jgi:hypothetical protein
MAADVVRQRFRVRQAAVRDDDHGWVVIGGMPGREPGGLASPDYENPAVLQADGVDSRCHGRRRHGDVSRADRRLGARALACVQRRFEQAIEQHTRRARPARQPVGFLDLSEDLDVAQHHGVEAARDAQQVRRHGRPAQQVPVRPRPQQVAAAQLLDRAAHLLLRGRDLRSDRVDFSAVAGREHERFAEHAAAPEPLEHVEHFSR